MTLALLLFLLQSIGDTNWLVQPVNLTSNDLMVIRAVDNLQPTVGYLRNGVWYLLEVTPDPRPTNVAGQLVRPMGQAKTSDIGYWLEGIWHPMTLVVDPPYFGTPDPRLTNSAGPALAILPAPTWVDVTDFGKRICLEWHHVGGLRFEVKIVSDGKLRRVYLEYGQTNLTTFKWQEVYGFGKTNIFSIRRLDPESKWSEEVTVRRN